MTETNMKTTKIKFNNNEIKKLIDAKEFTEFKLIALWKEQDNPRFKQLCFIYFDLATLLENNLETDEDIYELSKTIIFGYLSEKYSIVKDYLIQEKEKIWNINITDDWYKRIFLESIKAIINIIITNSYEDIKKSMGIIDSLRKEQKDFESAYLNTIDKENRPYRAGEIVSLYHFAKIVDLISQYLIQDTADRAFQSTHAHGVRLYLL